MFGWTNKVCKTQNTKCNLLLSAGNRESTEKRRNDLYYRRGKSECDK